MIDPTKKVFSLAEEFKAFAFKGNVIDMAVGVIIGGAFGGIVKSLVDHVIMPLISMIPFTAQDYKDWIYQHGDKKVPYGLFLADIVNFLIIAFVLFIFVVKFLGFIMRSKQEAPPPPPTKDQELLTEIRDLLKSQQAK
jgi:large conductance mechanosensitive channel